MEESIERIAKLLEVSPGGESDDWGEDISTDHNLYQTKEVKGDAYTEGRRVRAVGSSARQRVESARHSERLSGVEERLEAIEERSEASLDRVEKALTSLQDSMSANPKKKTTLKRKHSKKIRKSKL